MKWTYKKSERGNYYNLYRAGNLVLSNLTKKEAKFKADKQNELAKKENSTYLQTMINELKQIDS